MNRDPATEEQMREVHQKRRLRETIEFKLLARWEDEAPDLWAGPIPVTVPADFDPRKFARWVAETLVP